MNSQIINMNTGCEWHRRAWIIARAGGAHLQVFIDIELKVEGKRW
jgi:hypothetical protein